ncbi:MAG TPA: hypothetical protein VGF28_19820 [Thermoanaerobaculia bacterium]|jgi:hypothetical protein
MEQHIKILSVLFVLFGILGVVVAVAIGIFGASAVGTILLSDTSEEARAASAMIGGCVTIIAILFAALSIPSIIAGWGLSQRKSWARILTIILGVLALPHMPVGTALGIYAVIVMFNDETKTLLTA